MKVTFGRRLLSLGTSGRFLLCRKCADARGRSEELTIGLPGLLACESCGVVGKQGRGWTHQIGAYQRELPPAFDQAVREAAEAAGL